MPAFFEYLLKLSLCYAIIFLFYFICLKSVTHYSGNRFFLLISSVFAFFIPLVNIHFLPDTQTGNDLSILSNVPVVNIPTTGNVFIPGESGLSPAYVLFAVLVTGILLCALHFLMQLWSLRKIKAQAQLTGNNNHINIYQLTAYILPFSFGNAIYINPLRHTREELAGIIQHESVHVHQKHTIDVVAAEIICILNWYNPFAWLIKHAIKQNLEFLADDAVLKNGADKKSYQYLLLKVTGYAPLSIASNLNLSSLKNRIYMMNKSKTSRKHLLKFLFVFPLMAALLLAFRNDNPGAGPENNASIKEETFKLSELTYAIPDAAVETIVKKEHYKSLLQVGKPFTITLIKNERDRLKSLLEKNGYTGIGNHSITFLIDSSLTNNSFSVQVNIDLKIKDISLNQPGSLLHNNTGRSFNTENKDAGSLMSVYTQPVQSAIPVALFNTADNIYSNNAYITAA